MTSPTWTALHAVPDDVLFFRDGKPSSIGQDHYLRSLFPPYPSTLYGALRTRRLMDGGIDLTSLDGGKWGGLSAQIRSELGDWGGFGTLSLRGPWITWENGGSKEVLLPAPHDLGLVMKVTPSESASHASSSGREFERIQSVVRYQPVFSQPSGGEPRWSHPLALLRPYEWVNSGYRPWEGDDDPAAAVGWYLDAQGMKAWLDGRVPEPCHFVKQSELWKDEARTGVGLQGGKRIHEEHALYTFGFVRLMPGIAIGFEISGIQFNAGGHLRIGGEGRTARLEQGPSFPAFASSPGPRFAVYFATPCLSENGAYPPGFAGGQVDGSLHGNPCRLLAAAVKGGVLAGGWDIANKKPKPFRRAIPAGAVYHFLATTTADVSTLQGKNLSGYPAEHLAQQGFGLALVGALADLAE